MMYNIIEQQKVNIACEKEVQHEYEILVAGRGCRTLWGELSAYIQAGQVRGVAVGQDRQDVPGVGGAAQRLYG